MKNRLVGYLAGLLLILPTVVAGPLHAAVHSFTVRTYFDTNGNGVRDPGEMRYPGARVTNGVDVLYTGLNGLMNIQVDTADYRFVTMTVPSGFRATGAWYHHIVEGQAQPDTVEFGLQPDARRGADSFRMIHISDTQITTSQSYPMADDLLAMNRIPDPPLFIVNTGDVVDDGEIEAEWIYYAQQLESSAYPVFHAVGNHDDDPDNGTLEFYEKYAGPPYYSFEIGNWHFVGYNSWLADTYTPQQEAWLQNDVAQMPAGSHIAVFNHFMARDVALELRELWQGVGVDAVFSGHHHSINLSTGPTGIVDYNMSYTRGGGRDWTARSFNIVTFGEDGTLEADIRRLLVDHESRLQHPGADGEAVAGPLDITVQAYDSACRVTAIQATVFDQDGWTVATTALDPRGVSLWQQQLDTSAWTSGTYRIDVTGSFEDGAGIFLTRDFTFQAGTSLVARPLDDWPMFRRGPTGASWTERPLQPPLELAWTRPVPGMVAHNSPVVKDGRVFFGFRTERDPAAAGLMAFDAVTGAPLWHRHLPGGMALAPGVFGDVVVANALNDSVYAFDAASGAELWRLATPLGQFTQAAPTGDESGVLVSSKPYSYLVAPQTGAVIWQSAFIGDPRFEHVYTAAAFSDSRVFLNTYGGLGINGGLSIIDRATGSLLMNTINGTYRAPVVAGDTLYVIGGSRYSDQTLQARSHGHDPYWTSDVDIRRGMGAPALAHGHLVFAALNGAIRCVDAATGQGVWFRPVGAALLDMIHGSIGGMQTLAVPAIADDVVYVGSLDGRLYALDLYDGHELWHWDFGMPVASSAALSGNMLFVGCSDGNLYAFKGTSNFVTSAAGDPGDSGTRPYFRAVRRTPDQGFVELEWYQPAAGPVEISVFDLRGARVATVISEARPQGRHQQLWNGRDRSSRRVAAGIYFARIVTGGFEQTVKLVMVH